MKFSFFQTFRGPGLDLPYEIFRVEWRRWLIEHVLLRPSLSLQLPWAPTRPPPQRMGRGKLRVLPGSQGSRQQFKASGNSKSFSELNGYNAVGSEPLGTDLGSECGRGKNVTCFKNVFLVNSLRISYNVFYSTSSSPQIHSLGLSIYHLYFLTTFS